MLQSDNELIFSFLNRGSLLPKLDIQGLNYMKETLDFPTSSLFNKYVSIICPVLDSNVLEIHNTTLVVHI